MLLFFWLDNVGLAKERVRTRVMEGGHNIPEDVIERRYIGGIRNLFDIYLPIVDEIMIIDNSFGESEIIAQKLGNSNLEMKNITKFDKLKLML